LGVTSHQQMFGQPLAPGIAPELALLRPGAGELGDGAGIETVGLGQPALQLGEAAPPQRITRVNNQTGLFQHFADLALVAAAGLHGDHGDAQADQPSSQPGQALPVIVHRPALTRRHHIDVQLVLGDIEASQPYHIGHLPLPSLWVRASTRATVRADEDDGVRTLLRYGLCPRDLRSSRRRVVVVPAATTRFAFTASPRHKRPSHHDRPLIVERRSLRSASLRSAPVETTEMCLGNLGNLGNLRNLPRETTSETSETSETSAAGRRAAESGANG